VVGAKSVLLIALSCIVVSIMISIFAISVILSKDDRAHPEPLVQRDHGIVAPQKEPLADNGKPPAPNMAEPKDNPKSAVQPPAPDVAGQRSVLPPPAGNDVPSGGKQRLPLTRPRTATIPDNLGKATFKQFKCSKCGAAIWAFPAVSRAEDLRVLEDNCRIHLHSSRRNAGQETGRLDETSFESIAKKPGGIGEHFAILGRNSW
jgi:hypothetical protein